jgi:hypothetical protein
MVNDLGRKKEKTPYQGQSAFYGQRKTGLGSFLA